MYLLPPITVPLNLALELFAPSDVNVILPPDIIGTVSVKLHPVSLSKVPLLTKLGIGLTANDVIVVVPVEVLRK